MSLEKKLTKCQKLRIESRAIYGIAKYTVWGSDDNFKYLDKSMNRVFKYLSPRDQMPYCYTLGFLAGYKLDRRG